MERRDVFPVWVRALAVCSGCAYTILLMQTGSKLSFLVTALLSLGLLVYLVFRRGLLEWLLAPRAKWVYPVAALLSLSAVYTAKSTFFTTCKGWMGKAIAWAGLPGVTLRLIPWMVALAALPMAFCCFLWFVGFMGELILRLWRESDFTERLFFLMAGLLLAMLVVFSYVCTQAFFGAEINGRRFDFDLIYSADSGYLVRQDVFRNVGADQNDLRQPLYGLFAMPFAQGAWLVSRLLFLIPNSYSIVWQIFQNLLFLIALILLSRMMGLHGAEKAMFLCLLLVCWPAWIFALTAEQYLVAVFYLILLLYLREDKTGQTLAFLGATGCLLTSGIWFPVVTWDRDWKQFVKKTAALCGVFFAVTILCGRLTTFLDLPEYFEGFGYYSGADVAPVQKLMQYVAFAGSCFLAPASGADFTTYRHVSWQMLPVTDWSPVGLLVLGMALAGILLTRKDRLTRLSAVWIGFSLLLLGIVGWGTVDNGLLLYSLYFGWAFIAMVFRLLDRALSRSRPVKLMVLLLLILGLAVWNIYALRDVLIFGSQYYPALGGAA